MTKKYYYSKFYFEFLLKKPIICSINTPTILDKSSILGLNLINSYSKQAIDVHHLAWCLGTITSKKPYYSTYLKNMFQSNLFYISYNNEIGTLYNKIILDKNDCFFAKELNISLFFNKTFHLQKMGNILMTSHISLFVIPSVYNSLYFTINYIKNSIKNKKPV